MHQAEIEKRTEEEKEVEEKGKKEQNSQVESMTEVVISNLMLWHVNDINVVCHQKQECEKI